MQISGALLIDCSNCDTITNHGELSYIKVPFTQTTIFNTFALVLKPSENYIKRQWNYWWSYEHSVPEDYILRIMTCCCRDCCTWKWFLLTMWYCHMISIKWSKEKNRNIDIYKGIYLESPKHLTILFSFSYFLILFWSDHANQKCLSK